MSSLKQNDLLDLVNYLLGQPCTKFSLTDMNCFHQSNTKRMCERCRLYTIVENRLKELESNKYNYLDTPIKGDDAL